MVLVAVTGFGQEHDKEEAHRAAFDEHLTNLLTPSCFSGSSFGARYEGGRADPLLNPGDHVCAIYDGDDQLARIVGDFLAEGLRKSERCWYLPASDNPNALRAALNTHRIDATRAAERGALNILSSNAAYSVRGDFDPEETLAIFSNAIEDALADGFNGFRAAANMSWALDLEGGPGRLITYEALLRSLFSSARATGLCLYDRSRMPLAVIDGALCTHPVVRVGDGYSPNTFYDSGVQALRAVDPATVTRKLEQLKGVGPSLRAQPPIQREGPGGSRD